MYKFNSLPREEDDYRVDCSNKRREERGIDLSTGWDGELLHMSYVKYFN